MYSIVIGGTPAAKWEIGPRHSSSGERKMESGHQESVVEDSSHHIIHAPCPEKVVIGQDDIVIRRRKSTRIRLRYNK